MPAFPLVMQNLYFDLEEKMRLFMFFAIALTFLICVLPATADDATRYSELRQIARKPAHDIKAMEARSDANWEMTKLLAAAESRGEVLDTVSALTMISRVRGDRAKDPDVAFLRWQLR